MHKWFFFKNRKRVKFSWHSILWRGRFNHKFNIMRSLLNLFFLNKISISPNSFCVTYATYKYVRDVSFKCHVCYANSNILYPEAPGARSKCDVSHWSHVFIYSFRILRHTYMSLDTSYCLWIICHYVEFYALVNVY